MDAFRALDSDTLNARAKDSEERLRAIDNELTTLEPGIETGRYELKRSGAWLGLHVVVGIGGLISAPMTLGLSLAITLGDCALLIRAMNEYGDQSSRYHLMGLRFHQLKFESEEIADRLEAIRAVLEERSSTP